MVISVRLAEQAQDALDEAVRRGHYKDRSEAIRIALQRLLEDLEDEEEEKVTVTMSKADYNRLRRAKVFP